MSKPQEKIGFEEFKDFVKNAEAKAKAPVKSDTNKTSTTQPQDWFWEDDFNDFLYGGSKND